MQTFIVVADLHLIETGLLAPVVLQVHACCAATCETGIKTLEASDCAISGEHVWRYMKKKSKQRHASHVLKKEIKTLQSQC